MAASNSGEQSAAERPLLGRAVSRRAVLLAGGGALVLAGVRSSALSLAAVTAADTPTARLHLVRPQDMLVLDFDFYNLAPVSDVDPPVLRRVDPTKRCVVVAHFSSQHVMEENVHANAPTLPQPGTLAARAVGPSRIAFLVPETVKELPYREDGLLQWWQWVMQVVTEPGEPGPLQTDLLLVDWLHLTPDAVATWAHATAPVEHNGRTELWHTRLSLRGANGRPQESIAVSQPEPKTVPTVRAVYTPEDPEHTDLFDALDAADGPNGEPSVVKQIVQLSSNQSVDVYAPVRADLVALSATGATVDLLGRWKESAQALEVAGWEHHAWQGRDNKVVVEVYGFLFPFGHRALEVTETKRESDPDSGVAYLRQRKVIRVLEPVKSYPEPNHPAGGRAFPFTEVTIRTLVLPNLPETTVPLAAGGGDRAYWIQDATSPRPGGGFSDVVFALTATDLTGRRIEFTTPLGFIKKINGEEPGDGLLSAIRDKFATYADILGDNPDPRRVLDLGGQEVAYAPEKKPGTTSLPTDRWYWGVELATGTVTDPETGVKLVAFFPKLLAAQARVPALDAMIGPGQPVFLKHDDSYLKGEPGASRALAAGSDPEIFARVQESLEGISTLGTPGREDQPLVRRMESTAQAGGIAAPHLAVGALSANLGQVSGGQESIDKVRDTGTLVFKDYFPDLANGFKPPALLGDIPLSELFKDGDVTTGGPRLLKVLEYPKDAAGNPDRGKPPIGQTMTLYWQNNPVDVGPLEVRKDGSGNSVSQFRLECVSHVTFADPTRPTVTVSGRLTDFALVFVKPGARYIEVEFKRFSFRTEGSGKPKFDVDIGEVTFGGPFEFVNVLRDLISGVFGGSGGPASRSRPVALAAGNTPAGRPDIDVTPQGVTAAVRLGIPALPLGAFSISGLKFGAGVILPFTGGPVRARFAFSEPSDKFLVTAYGLGGGGHFIIEVSTRGVEMIEASIELAGNVALDLVVASGRLTIAAGIAFRLETGDPDTVTLTGYLRAMGRLSVLGLITICAEFYLALEYKKQGDQSTVTGRGFITVSIDILFFHKSVSIAFEKTFVGSGGGNGLRALAADDSARTFGDLVSRDDWEAYCASFAG